MARTDTETLMLTMAADVSRMTRALNKMEADAAKSTGVVEKRFDIMQERVRKTQERFAADMNTIFASIGVGLVARDVTRLADAYVEAGNKLGFAGVELDNLTKRQAELADLAVATRSEYESIVQLYSRMARAGDQLGAVSEQQLQTVTRTVAKALAGASQSEKNSAIVQLGQGLGSGVLQGDELRSIRENAPVVAAAIAKEFGVTIAQLKKLGEQGQLSASRVFKAILASADEVDDAFANTRATVGQAFENLRTRVLQYIGEADKANGSSKGLSAAINGVAANVDDMATVLTVVGAAALGIFGTRLAAATAAAIAQGAAVRGLSASLAFLGGPAGVAVAALAAGMAYLAVTTSKAHVEMRAQERVAADLEDITRRLDKATVTLAGAQGEMAKTAGEVSRALVKQIQERYELAKSTLAAAEAELQLREAQAEEQALSGRMDAEFPNAAALRTLGPALRLNERRAEVKALQAELEAAINKYVDADAAQRRLAAGAGPGTNNGAGSSNATSEQERRRMEAERVAASARVKLAQVAIDKALASEAAMRNGKTAAQELKRELYDEARTFLDTVPESASMARAELDRLRELLAKGIFNGIGAEKDAAEAQIDILTRMAYASADASEALAELARVSDLSPDRARAAARQIKSAAREARETRDEELGKIFRVDEISDTVRDGMLEAMRSGQWADILESRAADALDRAASRAFDKAVDILFEAAGAVFEQIKNNQSKSADGASGGGNFWSTLFSSILGGLFGGGRATGGPISPGKMYMTGERGPELIVPKSPGYVIPNNMLAALQSPARAATLTQRTEVNVRYSINLAGANGDQTIREIARREANRGAAEALRIANKQAPTRMMQFQKLGN